MERVNHLAVLVATVASFLWGWLWYSVFGGMWMTLMGRAKADMAPTATPFIVGFIMELIVAYAIAMAITRRPGEQSLQLGLSFAGFVGVLIVATQLLEVYMYSSRPVALWCIDAGNLVTAMLLTGAIVGAWKKKGVA